MEHAFGLGGGPSSADGPRTPRTRALMQRRLAAEINQSAGSGPSPAPAVAPPTTSAEAQGQHRFKLSQGGPSRGPDNWQELGLPAGHDGRNWAGNPGRFTARDNELHMHPTAQRVLHRWWPQKNWQSEALIVQRPQPREGGRKSAEGKVWSPRRGWVWPTEKAAGQRRAHGTWAWPSSWTKGRPRDQDHEQQQPLPPAERERAAPAEPPPHEIIHTSSGARVVGPPLEWQANLAGRTTLPAGDPVRSQQGTGAQLANWRALWANTASFRCEAPGGRQPPPALPTGGIMPADEAAAVETPRTQRTPRTPRRSRFAPPAATGLASRLRSSSASLAHRDGSIGSAAGLRGSRDDSSIDEAKRRSTAWGDFPSRQPLHRSFSFAPRSSAPLQPAPAYLASYPTAYHRARARSDGARERWCVVNTGVERVLCC